MNKPTRPYQ